MSSKKIKYVRAHSRNDTRKISKISEDAITFTDGSTITYDHNQDCCEWNYADFGQLDDIANDYTFEGKMLFEEASGGFMFGDTRRMFYIPCYSSQNGYYTTEIDIYYNGVCQLHFDAQEDFD